MLRLCWPEGYAFSSLLCGPNPQAHLSEDCECSDDITLTVFNLFMCCSCFVHALLMLSYFAELILFEAPFCWRHSSSTEKPSPSFPSKPWSHGVKDCWPRGATLTKAHASMACAPWPWQCSTAHQWHRFVSLMWCS